MKVITITDEEFRAISDKVNEKLIVDMDNIGEEKGKKDTKASFILGLSNIIFAAELERELFKDK